MGDRTMNNSRSETTAEKLLAQSDWLRGLARAVVRDRAAAEDLV